MGLALQSLLGIILIPLAAYAISEDRSQNRSQRTLRIVVGGLALQVLAAGVLLKVPQSKIIFDGIGAAVGALQAATEAGLRLVFGYLAGQTPPFEPVRPEANYILAFRALPLILVVSAKRQDKARGLRLLRKRQSAAGEITEYE